MRSATAEPSRVTSDTLITSSGVTRVRKRPRKPSTALLPAAARIVREWGGVRHEVTVVENGRAYRYRDRTYKSLTEVARAITGTHQSGPRFFGLVTRVGEKKQQDHSAAKRGKGT